jgi:NAD(P)-dependent dehydrogenase (short-subunit alcohol dehydrogenase family)
MSRQSLAGKVALITGAGSGIGRAIVDLFATEGAKVACMDIDETSAKAVAKSIADAGRQALAIHGDVSASADAAKAVEATVSAFGDLHILINNAAFFMPDGTLADIDEGLFDRSFAVNVGGTFRMSRFAIPAIRRSGGGAIVHMASQMGHVARKHQATYCASKGALLTLAKAMALDHAGDRIRVNTISPGGIATEGMAAQWGSMEIAEREWGARMHPIGRLGKVNEVAAAALFLASDASSFVTGTDLLVDGGYAAW